MSSTPTRTGNLILDRLPEDECRLVLSSADTVSLTVGEEVYRQDGPIPYVYFPTGGVFSVIILMEEGKRVEAVTIGNEGMAGISAFLGLDFSPFTTVFQVPGESLQVSTAKLRQVIKPGSMLDRLLHRYAAYGLRYASQTGACNAVHPVNERMCRWLLMAHDRAGRDEFLLTQEFLAQMLGVRRQTVTLSAGTLQGAGLLTYRRGKVRILNREGLEHSSCECYAATQALYARIMF